MSNRFTKGKGLFASIQTTGGATIGGALTASSVASGGGLTMGAITRGTVAVDPAAINSLAKGTTWVAVADAGANDLYWPIPPATLEGQLIYSGYRTVAGSLGIILTNAGTASANGGSIDWTFTRLAVS